MLVRDSIGLVYIPLFVSWLVHFVSCATELRVKNHMDLISSFNLPPPPKKKGGLAYTCLNGPCLPQNAIFQIPRQLHPY